MRLWLVGLTDQESAAIEVMARTGLAGADCLIQGRNPALTAPALSPANRACDACVIDLFGIGLRRHSRENEARLHALLQGRPALIGYWGVGGGLLESAAGADAALIWVRMPSGSSVMRSSLEALAQRVAPMSTFQKTASAPAPVPTPAAPAPAPTGGSQSWMERATRLRDSLLASRSTRRPAVAPPAEPARGAEPVAPPPAPSRMSGLLGGRTYATRPPAPTEASAPPASARTVHRAAPTPVPAPTPAPPTAPQTPRAPATAPAPAALPKAAEPVAPSFVAVHSTAAAIALNDGGYALLCEAVPELHTVPLFQLIGPALASGGLTELRGGGGLTLLLHPAEGWAASDVAPTAVRKLLQAPDVLRGVSAHAVPPEQAEQRLAEFRARRGRDPRVPLDMFLWPLVDRALHAQPLSLHGGLSFRVNVFPNFTLLHEVPPLFVQLAAIGVRMPLDVRRLRDLFGHERRSDVARFVVLCVVTGLAVVLNDKAALAGFGVGAAASAPVLDGAHSRTPATAASTMAETAPSAGVPPAHHAAPAAVPASPAGAQPAAREGGFLRSLLKKLF